MTAAGRDTPVDPGADANLLQRLAGEIGCDSHQLRWRFIGSARGPCRVWQVSGAGEAGALIVKQFRGERAFQQEHHAYRSWLPQLPEETATLLAAFAAPVRALVLAQVAGEPLTVAPVGPELERAAHKRAGYFLRALHAVPEPDRDPVAIGQAVRLRYAAWLSRVRPAVSDEAFAELGDASPKITIDKLETFDEVASPPLDVGRVALGRVALGVGAVVRGAVVV